MDVSCYGTETSLTDCRHVSADGCAHYEDAGVRCTVQGKKSI